MEYEFKPTKKRLDYTVQARVQPIGTKIYNKLEDAHYEITNPNQVVLKGTQGEEWVTDIVRLVNTYQTLNGRLICISDLTSEWLTIRPQGTPKAQFASHIPVANQLQVTCWGATLTANRPGIPHGKGDMLVCDAKDDGTPDSDNAWIVNGLVFKATYDTRAFDDIK